MNLRDARCSSRSGTSLIPHPSSLLLLSAPTMATDKTEERAAEPLRLAATHLVKVYKRRKVVRDVSVDIKQGEIVGLLGPNGAGKTTTFYMIVGLVRPDDGHVTLGDDDITSLPMYLRAQRGISYLPQEASVFRKLTVE